MIILEHRYHIKVVQYISLLVLFYNPDQTQVSDDDLSLGGYRADRLKKVVRFFKTKGGNLIENIF